MTYDYDAYGNVLRHVGPTPLVTRFQGETVDEDTGLIYLRARWYNPDLGRFMEMDGYEGDQEDPLSLHKYSFVSNNPENEIDPSGNVAGPSSNTPLFGSVSAMLQDKFLLQRVDVDSLSISLQGFQFTKGWESFYNYIYDDKKRSHRYSPPGDVKAIGKWTVGYGHKCNSGDLTKYVNGITEPDAADLFRHDMNYFVDRTQYYVDVPLYQYEFDAITDLIFNAGEGKFSDGPVCSWLNNGDYKDVPNLIRGFDIPPKTSKTHNGVVNRRLAESVLFGTGKY